MQQKSQNQHQFSDRPKLTNIIQEQEYVHILFVLQTCLGWLKSKLVMLLASSLCSCLEYAVQLEVLIGMLPDRTVCSRLSQVRELLMYVEALWIVVYSSYLEVKGFLGESTRIPVLTTMCFYWYCLSKRIEWSRAKVTPCFEPCRDLERDRRSCTGCSTNLLRLDCEPKGRGGLEIFIQRILFIIVFVLTSHQNHIYISQYIHSKIQSIDNQPTQNKAKKQYNPSHVNNQHNPKIQQHQK